MFILRSRKKKLLLLPLAALAFCFSYAGTVSAQYLQHNLIDDNIFLDAGSMSQAQIQSFLVARGSYLANYSSYSGRDGGNVLASQIIYEAAQDYGISPKVILATLQKEQSLVTATNPSATQLQKAMGYGCPDSAACNDKYYGLFNQVDNGAWQFRKNFERARGNTSWWSSSPGYACSGATRYYNTGLYRGRNVTFYDDNGTAIQTFTLNNAATASLYCYTPHPYNNPNGLYGNPAYGYTGQYYSGSYNFVLWFERWFGSTQPSVAISSALRVSTAVGTVYSGAPTTASFDMLNNTGDTQSVNVAVTVRNASGANLDYPLKTITIPPYGKATYSATKTFTGEGQFTFGITSYVNNGWDDNYPASSNIDNSRIATPNVQIMPTITTSPTTSITDMRLGRPSAVTFTIRNNSSQPITIGKVALAMRDPDGRNVDMPLVDPGQIAAGGEYIYSRQMTPQKTGLYKAYIVATKDDGLTWDSENYPATTASTTRTLQFSVGPNPTLSSGPTLNIVSPRAGQKVTLGINIKNYSESPANAGYIGIAVRDPDGRNVDIGGATLSSIAANSTYTFSGTRAFTKPGVYTAWVVSYINESWREDLPAADNGSVQRKVQFTVKPSPTLTQGLTITNGTGLKAGDTLTGTFKVKNYGDSALTVNKSLCYIVRDSQGRNNDLGCLDVGVIQAGQELTYTGSRVLTNSGSYRAYFSMYDGSWHDNQTFDLDTGNEPTTLNFTVKGNPVMTQGLTLTNTNLRKGDAMTGTFKVMNRGTVALTVNKSLCYIVRDSQGRNNDLGCLDVGVIQAGQELTYTGSRVLTNSGSYRAYFSMYDGSWHDNQTFDLDTGNEPTTLNFTVQP